MNLDAFGSIHVCMLQFISVQEEPGGGKPYTQCNVSQCLLCLSLPTHISIHVERWPRAAAMTREAHREPQVSSFKDLGCQQTQGLCITAGRGGDQ